MNSNKGARHPATAAATVAEASVEGKANAELAGVQVVALIPPIHHIN